MNYAAFNDAKVVNEPFPHLVVHNFADEAQELYKHFPRPNASWYYYNNPLERKHATDLRDLIPYPLQIYMDRMCRPDILKTLETKFDIDPLIPDPYFRGGGLHCIEQGGKLDIHADFNIHPKLKLKRALNAILYLNPGWKPDHGGALELWNKEMTRCEVLIPPKLGTLVVFKTDSNSFHGHPEPWQEKETRKSVALYYYTIPNKDEQPHSTLYQPRPQDAPSAVLDDLRAKRAKARL